VPKIVRIRWLGAAPKIGELHACWRHFSLHTLLYLNTLARGGALGFLAVGPTLELYSSTLYHPSSPFLPSPFPSRSCPFPFPFPSLLSSSIGPVPSLPFPSSMNRLKNSNGLKVWHLSNGNITAGSPVRTGCNCIYREHG
jgi:hypothetical protein